MEVILLAGGTGPGWESGGADGGWWGGRLARARQVGEGFESGVVFGRVCWS